MVWLFKFGRGRISVFKATSFLRVFRLWRLRSLGIIPTSHRSVLTTNTITRNKYDNSKQLLDICNHGRHQEELLIMSSEGECFEYSLKRRSHPIWKIWRGRHGCHSIRNDLWVGNIKLARRHSQKRRTKDPVRIVCLCGDLRWKSEERASGVQTWLSQVKLFFFSVGNINWSYLR